MVIHSVGGIDAKIHHDLHDLRGVGHDRGIRRRYAALKRQFDRGSQRGTQQGECIAHLDLDVHLTGIARPGTRKIEHARDEIAGAKAAADDLPNILLGFRTLGLIIPVNSA
jgi:hypothetical protein